MPRPLVVHQMQFQSESLLAYWVSEEHSERSRNQVAQGGGMPKIRHIGWGERGRGVWTLNAKLTAFSEMTYSACKMASLQLISMRDNI